jgi:hypothetical protein
MSPAPGDLHQCVLSTCRWQAGERRFLLALGSHPNIVLNFREALEQRLRSPDGGQQSTLPPWRAERGSQYPFPLCGGRLG